VLREHPARRVLVVASTFPASESDESPAFVRDLVVAMQREAPGVAFAVLAPHVGRRTAPYAQHAEYEEYRFRYAWPAGLQRLTGRGILPALAHEPWLLLLVPFLFLGEGIALRKLVRSWKPDVIHAHWFTPQGVVAAVVSRMTGVPFVLTTHASDVSVWRRVPVLGRAIVRRFLPRAAAITAVSTQTLARARAFFSDQEWKHLEPRTRILPMGVTVPAEDPVAARPTPDTILFIGRLAAKKGVSVLLEAFASLERADVRLVIAGSGPEQDALARDVRRRGIEPQVEFTGFVTGDAKRALIARADVIVVPSVETSDGDAEGLPVVVLEALAAGKPCIATDASGAGDVITHGANGWLVPQRDASALALALGGILSLSAAERDAVGRRAREGAQQFSWPTVARRHWQFLFADARDVPRG
jgi:glycosyltransferase involved in cell wall biosynthesis